jgi:tetratricopeptide (TPR) repeat protein
MMLSVLLLAAAGGLTSTTPGGAVTVIGNSLARSCYEAAEARGNANGADIDTCTRALGNEALGLHDETATLVNRGILHARKGDLARAFSDLDAAMARNPAEPGSYYNKAAILLARPDGARQAVPLFTAAIDRKTKLMAKAFHGRGIAHEELGDLKAAYQDYRRASELDPKWEEPRRELARFTVRRAD